VLHFWPTYSHTHTHPLAKGEIQTIQKAQKWANSECRATEKKRQKTRWKNRENSPTAKPVSRKGKGGGGGQHGRRGCGLDGGTYVIAPALTAAPFVYPCVFGPNHSTKGRKRKTRLWGLVTLPKSSQYFGYAKQKI